MGGWVDEWMMLRVMMRGAQGLRCVRRSAGTQGDAHALSQTQDHTRHGHGSFLIVCILLFLILEVLQICCVERYLPPTLTIP